MFFREISVPRWCECDLKSQVLLRRDFRRPHKKPALYLHIASQFSQNDCLMCCRTFYLYQAIIWENCYLSFTPEETEIRRGYATYWITELNRGSTGIQIGFSHSMSSIFSTDLFWITHHCLSKSVVVKSFFSCQQATCNVYALHILGSNKNCFKINLELRLGVKERLLCWLWKHSMFLPCPTRSYQLY